MDNVTISTLLTPADFKASAAAEAVDPVVNKSSIKRILAFFNSLECSILKAPCIFVQRSFTETTAWFLVCRDLFKMLFDKGIDKFCDNSFPISCA